MSSFFFAAVSNFIGSYHVLPSCLGLQICAGLEEDRESYRHQDSHPGLDTSYIRNDVLFNTFFRLYPMAGTIPHSMMTPREWRVGAAAFPHTSLQILCAPR